MKLWASFEERVLKESWARGIFVSRIPTGCKVVFQRGRMRTIMVKTDFDFAAGCEGRAIFFDAKAEAGKSFNFKSKALSDAKRHQFDKMREAWSMGNKAGYLIWFYSLRKITWAPIEVIDQMLERGEKGLNPDSPGCVTQDDFIVIDIGNLALD